jgi:SNF2 family DNA or RNA helicase
MFYQGKAVEILGEKEVLGRDIVWIRFPEDHSVKQVAKSELTAGIDQLQIPAIKYISIAAKIQDEVARKNILAPYESSLIPLPHQILVLEKVMQSSQNRFLLADEVGMGKTIETGLILKELKLRGEIKRVLTIVPKSSMLQWQSELKEHFNEMFHIYDSDVITSMARTFSNINADEEFNFWRQHNQIIVSTDALKPLESRQGWSREKVDEYNKYRIEAVLDADFDLVIIDEAHKMGGANATVSRYVLAQELCNTVPNVLLLTATPHRGKSDHFRRVLQLLDPDAFDGEGLPEIAELEPYVIRTEKRLAVDYDGKKLFNKRQTNLLRVSFDINRHQKQMALYQAVTDYVKTGFNQASRTGNTSVGLIMVLFQRLVSSSTAAILSAMRGRLLRLQADEAESISDFTEDWDSNTEEFTEDFDLEGIHYDQHFSQGKDEIAILQGLIRMAEQCQIEETDAKAEALLKKLKELESQDLAHPPKILVFTEFKSTQVMLKRFFEKNGYQCESINGSQDLDQRKAALTNFKNESRIMVATDAAGESLNMQFCHIIFNYDLPWNPMMIEQRIGRVDRIGQKHEVQAFNILTENSVDLRVYEVIEEKLQHIMNQLGIDKTSDVLDSTIDVKKVNRLYLQSLLDPKRFEFAGDQWLHEIRNKLRDFQSTEGVLPQVNESEIESKKASDVKYSPLSNWMESMLEHYSLANSGQYKRNLLGYSEINISMFKGKIAFDSEIALNNPDVEHITLQHDVIKSVLNGLPIFDNQQQIPVIQFDGNSDTPGYWGLWKVSANGVTEIKSVYCALFYSDTGKVYTAYGNDLWTRLINSESIQLLGYTDWIDLETELSGHLLQVFENLEGKIREQSVAKRINKDKSYQYQRGRIEKIGIANIREAKLKRLDQEYQSWIEAFEKNQTVLPHLKHLLTLRIDG